VRRIQNACSTRQPSSAAVCATSAKNCPAGTPRRVQNGSAGVPVRRQCVRCKPSKPPGRKPKECSRGDNERATDNEASTLIRGRRAAAVRCSGGMWRRVREEARCMAGERCMKRAGRQARGRVRAYGTVALAVERVYAGAGSAQVIEYRREPIRSVRAARVPRVWRCVVQEFALNGKAHRTCRCAVLVVRVWGCGAASAGASRWKSPRAHILRG